MKEYNDFGNLCFIGEYLDGKRNGEGSEYQDGKLFFEGEFLNGERKKGNYYYSDKSYDSPYQIINIYEYQKNSNFQRFT